MDKLYIFIVEKSCTNEMKNIKLHYKEMMGKLKSSYESHSLKAINDWREEFKYCKSAFIENKKSFEPQNLKELFQLTYEHKCSYSINPLLLIYQEVITVRIMYLHIICVYYGDVSVSVNDIELQNFSRDMNFISKAMSETCHFFEALRMLKSKKKDFDTSK